MLGSIHGEEGFVHRSRSVAWWAQSFCLLLVLACVTPADAANYTLRGSDYWGDVSLPFGWYNDDLNSYGFLPTSSDDTDTSTSCDVLIGVPCADLHMENTQALGGGPATATVRTFYASGKRLIMEQGSSLWVTDGGAMSGLRMNGGTFIASSDYQSPFEITRVVDIEWGGATNPSVIGGNPLLLDTATTTVEGTLEFRNGNTQARVTNRGLFIQSGTYGNTTFFFDMDFRNEAGGTVELRNDNGFASQPSGGNPAAILFYNDDGATLAKTAGSGDSVIEMGIVNEGTIDVTSGRLTLRGGGTHGDAVWQGSDTGVLALDGAHLITGAVTSTARVEAGFANVPSSLTIGDGALLDNQGALLQIQGPTTVAAGGRLENRNLLQADHLVIDAGGALLNTDATLVLWSSSQLENSGEVTIEGGGGIVDDFIAGNGSYLQHAGGTTLIRAGSYIQLGSGSSYEQEDGVTTVRGSLTAEMVHFAAGELRGAGTITADVLSIDAGVLVSPGESPGLLTIDGNLEATGAIFDIEIAGIDPGLSFDQIWVTGDTIFDGGEVRLHFIDGFLPGTDDVFQWLVAGAALSGIDSLQMIVSSDTGFVDGYLDSSTGAFVVTEVSEVPLPGSAWLLATAFGAAGVRARRAKASRANC